jgi:hypothetical protein
VKRAQLEHIIGAAATIAEDDDIVVQGVGEETATLPVGWKDRLVPVRSRRTRGATGWCLEVHDLVIAKLFAGREKDLAFATVAARHHLVDPAVLHQRLALVRNEDVLVPIVAQRIDSYCREKP